MKKRITSLLIAISMAFSLMPFFSMSVSADSKPSGSGTVDDPYKIGSVEEFFWFRDKVNGENGLTINRYACADLTQNLNFENQEINDPIYYYYGTFDGRNHTISGVNIQLDAAYVGLFRRTEVNAVIKNLHVRGSVSGGTSVGGIVGYLAGKGTIHNCSFSGTVTATASAYGGIAGAMQHGGTIEYCWSAGTVTSSSVAEPYWPNGGGIVGVASKDGDAQIITKSYSTANVHSNHHAGGLIAAVDGSTSNQNSVTISDCWTSGAVTSTLDPTKYTLGSILSCANQSAIVTRTLHYGNAAINLANFHDDAVARPGTSYTNNFSLNARTDNLRNSSATVISADQFKSDVVFKNAGWDFENTWKMGADHPILKQSIVASSKSRTLEFYNDADAEFNLPDYFDLVLAEDQNYNQDKRFTFTFPTNATETVSEFNQLTMQYDPKEETLASISASDSDKLVLNKNMPIGTYTITVKASDNNTTKYDDYQFNLTIKVKKRVPKPEILMDSVSYDRLGKLFDIVLSDKWEWGDPSICPKTDPDGNIYSYEAYYPFEAGKSEYYDLSALDDAGISYTVDETNNRFKVMLSPKVLESDETPQETFITVIDEDTLEPVVGANVATEYGDEFDAPGYNTTDASGISYGFLSPGYRDITVTKSGYETKTDTKQIQKGTNNVTIYLRPNRTTVKIPDVKELLSAEPLEEGEIKGALVSVTRISDTATKAWLGDSVSMTADAMAELELPPGDFAFRNATYGYSTDDVVFARVDALTQTVTFYSDSAFTPGTELTVTDNYTLHASKMNDPTYNVTIDHAAGTLTYTAAVTLSNIKANYGTFGIHYDPTIMSMTNVTYGADIDADSSALKKVEDFYTAQGAAPWSNDNGYYVFVWDAKLDDETEETLINAETGTEDIATFTFTLKSQSFEDYLTADTFMIEPWQDTKAAKSVSDDGLKALFGEYFRYVDGDNNPNNLKEGRLAASKASVTISDATPISTSVETNGFFQARVPQPLGSEELEKDYDVKTEIKYNFKITNAVLRFHVTDKHSGWELPNSFVRLFDYDQNLVNSKNTNENGRASFAVKPENYNEPSFFYDVAKTGYWPLPESGLVSDRPSVTAETAKVTEVEVELEQKVYHKPVLKKEGAESELELVTDAELGGQKFAYNDRDYHFRVKAARGYKITAYPTKAYVYVDDTTIIEELRPDPNGLFTLDKSYMNVDRFDDLRALEASELTALKAADTDYADWAGTQPDDEGYRGYNLVIKFDDFRTEELEYIVEGVTNDRGYVTYAKDAGEDDCDITETDEKDPHEYIMVKTKNSEHGGPNHNTGTFTFTGNGDNIVERVYINGLEIDTYDDLHEFSYTFGEVDMDCNITVLFWDGVTPSDDTVMTLVVGEYGFADVKTPVEENDVMLTRRVYLNPTADLEFVAHPMKGYTLYKVEKEVAGNPIEDITTAALTASEDRTVDDTTVTYSTYKISKPTAAEQNITVYVTFMHPDAPTKKTPNLFVKSYVYTGTGVNDPAGILIYSKYDTVEIDLAADEDDTWLVKGVMLSPYEDLDDVTEYEFPKLSKTNTYRYDTLLTSIGIGSEFVERGYPLSGYIDLGQFGTASDGETNKPLSGATVTFVRLDDATGTVELPKAARYVRASQPLRHNSLFNLDLPAGRWNVYVEKQGYVTYKITDFVMTPTAYDAETDTYAETKFGVGTDNVQKHIAPYIGSTKTGTSISLTDASGVKSGMRSGLSAAQKAKADVDNNDRVTATDLAYVWFNYNKLMFEQPYSDFKENGSRTTPYV